MNKIKTLIQEVGLDFKHEMILLLIINILIIAMSATITIITQIYYFLLVFAAILLVFNIAFLGRYSSLKRKLENDRTREFVSLFTYFEIYINNGLNVYTSIQNIALFASPYIKEKFDLLIFEIDGDKSVNPFIHFAACFKSLLIEQIMVSVYQMIDQGNDSSYLHQFQKLFGKISDEEHHQEIVLKMKKIDNLSVTPLIGAAMVTIIVTIGIVIIIGGIIGGL